jgi:RIP metalloprotease RseP
MNRDQNSKLLLLFGAFVSLAFLGGISAVVVVLSIVLIFFFHELGHYLVARMSGMQVTEFFIGFGPRIFSFHRGETEYGLKAIPAGAYVRVTGMNNLEVVDPAIENRTYRAQTYPKRLALTLAGSATHFLLALFLLVVIFVTIGEPHPTKWDVGQVVADSTADKVGVVTGDRILSVGGQQIDSFDSFGKAVGQNPGKFLEIQFEREGQQLNKFATIGERLTPEGASFLDGIDARDQLISVDGLPYLNWEEFSSILTDGNFHEVKVNKSGLRVETFELKATELPDSQVAVRGFFGVGPQRSFESLSLADSVPATFDRFAEISVASVEGLTGFFSPEGLTGFVKGTFNNENKSLTEQVESQVESEDDRLLSIYGAARLGSAMLDEGTHNYLWFLVLINVFVGIFNLVPLLPLDGGHAAIATYERLRSRKEKRYVADITKLIPVTWAVITVLVGIALIALYRDIVDLPNFG